MSMHFLLYAGAVVTAVLLTAIAVRCGPVRWQAASLALAAVLMALFFAATASLLGQVKPERLEFNPDRLKDAQVIAHNLRPGDSIDVWVLPKDGTGAPLAYSLPWSEEHARELHESQKQQERGGGTVRLGRMMDADREPSEPLFYAEPPQPLPPKRIED